MLDIVRGEMVTINDRFTKKNREFLRRIVNVSQDSDIVRQIPSEMTDSESKSKSKGDNTRTQALTCGRQTATHQQVREVHNIEIVEHASENDEEGDEHLDDRFESEQIMVPSGKYPIDEGKCCESRVLDSHSIVSGNSSLDNLQILDFSDPSKWSSSHINEWISWCSRTFAIRLGSIAAILPSSGKELLRLTLRDWQEIGGTGGSILARHLAHLRLQATGIYTPGLLQENENSEITGESKLKNHYSLTY